MTDNTIVCVLKSGVFHPRGDTDYEVQYDARHVRWLRDQCRNQLKQEHNFICLTDIEIPDVETRPLRDNLPGWWSKMEIYREFRHACYMDLDTVLVGDSSPYLFAVHKFTVLRGMHLRGNGAINTSLVCWDGDYSFLYDAFMADKDRVMAEYVKNDRWGDQGFVRDAIAGKRDVSIFNIRFPGVVVRYSKDMVEDPEFPTRKQSWATRRAHRLGQDWMKTPRIVAFNTAQKPWDVEEDWIPKLENINGGNDR